LLGRADTLYLIFIISSEKISFSDRLFVSLGTLYSRVVQGVLKVTENYVNSTNFHPEGEVALQAFSTLQGKLPPLKATPGFEYKDLLNSANPSQHLVSQAVEVAMLNSHPVSSSNSLHKRQTLQQILQQRQQLTFVGREEQIARFRQNLELPFLDCQYRFIFNVFGPGGVGKTLLLRQFCQIAANAKFLSVYTNELETSIPAVMACLARQLEQQGYRLNTFTESYHVYQQKQQQLAAAGDLPQGFSAFLPDVTAAADVCLQLQIPGTAVFLEYTDKETEATQTQRASYLNKKIHNKEELRLLQEPVAVLTPLFLQDLWQVAENTNIALFFDTYDRTETFLDPWLREILDGRYGDVPPNILLVIAGRQKLHQDSWTRYENSIEYLHLESFTEREAKQYLCHKGIHDSQTIDAIVRLSEGLPVLLATLAAETPQDVSQVVDTRSAASRRDNTNALVIERFLKSLKQPKQRQGVLSAAIPRYLHREILAQLRGEQEADELLEWLKQMPFVTAVYPHGWAYHETIKTLILRYQRLSSPQTWTQLHEKLAAYYDSLANQLQLDERQKWCHPIWQSHKLNALYHRLCQCTQKNLPLACNEFLLALQNQYEFACSWAEIILQAGKDTDAVEVQRWGEKLLQGLKALKKQDYEVTATMLTALIEQGKLDAKWRAVALSFRGAIYYQNKNYEEALKDLKQAATAVEATLTLANLVRGSIYIEQRRYSEAIKNFDQLVAADPLNVRAIAQRGYTYYLMKQYQQAIQDFDRAIAVDPNDTWARMQRGYNNILLQRYEEAIQDLDCLLAINSNNLSAVVLRGIAYYLLARYSQAVSDFNCSLSLQPNHIKLLLLRGAAYYLLQRYSEATEDFSCVLKQNPDQIQALVLRAATYQLMECYVEAILDFDRAIELEPTHQWAIALRGQTYRQIQDYTKALQDFDRAIDLDANDIQTIINRGETYQLMGNYEKALKDFHRAIALNPNHSGAITSRGEIHQLMKLYQQALQDFDRAIELDPNYTRAIICRGETYQLMGRYEQALQDFNAAMKIKSQDPWLLVCRGETYQLMGRYDEALKDFNHALSLDPNYTWAMTCRGETYQLMEHYDQALQDLHRAIELDPTNDRAFAARGYTHWCANSYQQALKDFECALELNPGNDRAWVGRGYTYRAMNRHTAALKDFERALEINSNNGWALTGRGSTFCRMERYAEALKDFDRALELSSKQHYEWALAGRGYTYLLLKRYKEALTDLHRAVELNGNNDWYLYLRALAFQTLNQATEARTDLALAIKLAKQRYQNNPQNWRNTFNLALYYLAVQYYPTVENLYRYAISKGASLEDIREAIHDLDDFLTIFPEHLQAKFMRQLLQSAFN
jgi:tetratricopeptide (TPR) repeat protein